MVFRCRDFASLIFTPIIGIIASPVGLFLAEWYRLKDRPAAFSSTKTWLTGWGWSVAARIGIGIVMIAFWAGGRGNRRLGNRRIPIIPFVLSEPGQLLLNGLTLIALIFSLLSLFFPLFPGLIVMWLALLPYISIQALMGNMHWSKLVGLRHHHGLDVRRQCRGYFHY